MTPERLKELRWQSANHMCSPEVHELIQELARVQLQLDDAQARLAEASEAGRAAERKRVVEWLRSVARVGFGPLEARCDEVGILAIACAIEQEEHLTT